MSTSFFVGRNCGAASVGECNRVIKYCQVSSQRKLASLKSFKLTFRWLQIIQSHFVKSKENNNKKRPKQK